jgi:hypothetical protein
MHLQWEHLTEEWEQLPIPTAELGLASATTTECYTGTPTKLLFLLTFVN